MLGEAPYAALGASGGGACPAIHRSGTPLVGRPLVKGSVAAMTVKTAVRHGVSSLLRSSPVAPGGTPLLTLELARQGVPVGPATRSRAAVGVVLIAALAGLQVAARQRESRCHRRQPALACGHFDGGAAPRARHELHCVPPALARCRSRRLVRTCCRPGRCCGPRSRSETPDFDHAKRQSPRIENHVLSIKA
jgi:hypothetical protein